MRYIHLWCIKIPNIKSIAMKHTLILASLLSITIGVSAFNPAVNEKVLNSFKKTFSAAQEVKWDESKDHYTVCFKNYGIRTTVNYDRKGNMLSTIRYYQPELLPINVLDKLTREYSNADLFGVTEIAVGNSVAYFVKIEGSKYWTTVKADSMGNTEVVEKYRKA